MSFVQSPLQPMSAEDTAACIQFWNNTVCRLSSLDLEDADIKAGLDIKAVARIEMPPAEGPGQLVIYLYVGDDWQALPQPEPFLWQSPLWDVEIALEKAAARLDSGKPINRASLAVSITACAKKLDELAAEMDATMEDGAPEWQPIPEDSAAGVLGFYSLLHTIQ